MKSHGYTLIEILIVLFIISIVTSVALLSISRNQNKQLETFANNLTQTLTLAEEQAMLQPMVLGLSFSENSFQFATFERAASGKKDRWLPSQDSMLSKHKIPTDIQVTVDMHQNEKSTSAKPQIIISTNGDITPFTIYIGKPGEKPRYAVIGDVDGNVTNKSLA